MLAKNPARKFHCIQWTKIRRDYCNKLPFRKGLGFFVWTIIFFDSLSFAWYTSSSSALIDPFGGDIFLYGSFVLFSLDCFWKLVLLPSFDVSVDHTPCVLDPLMQIYNFVPLTWTIIYMRELIAVGGRRDNSGAPNYGFLPKIHWKRFLDYTYVQISPHVRKSGFRNPGMFCLWNPESWALESGIQHWESGILLKIGIRNPTY